MDRYYLGCRASVAKYAHSMVALHHSDEEAWVQAVTNYGKRFGLPDDEIEQIITSERSLQHIRKVREEIREERGQDGKANQ